MTRGSSEHALARAYDVLYLEDAMACLGCFFDYAINDYGAEGREVAALFAASSLARQFETGAPWVVFAVLGLITSLMTVFGDLVESVIKRRLGVKDMGKIMPTHGGILDRIDGTLFASMFVYIVFALFVVPPIA